MKTLYESIFNHDYDSDFNRVVNLPELEKLFGKGISWSGNTLIVHPARSLVIIDDYYMSVIKSHGFTGLRVDHKSGKLNLNITTLEDFSLESDEVWFNFNSNNSAKLKNVQVRSNTILVPNSIACENCKFEHISTNLIMRLEHPLECSFDSKCSIKAYGVKMGTPAIPPSERLIEYIKKHMISELDNEHKKVKFAEDPLKLINFDGTIDVEFMECEFANPDNKHLGGIQFFPQKPDKKKVNQSYLYKTNIRKWPYASFCLEADTILGITK